MQPGDDITHGNHDVAVHAEVHDSSATGRRPIIYPATQPTCNRRGL